MSRTTEKIFFSPKELQLQYPAPLFIEKSRTIARNIYLEQDPRMAILVGPCSVHDLASTLEFAKRLKTLSLQLPSLFLILRVFIEKPRTTTGWKGFVYDPRLDGSHRLEEGLVLSRQLLYELANLNIPCATEFLDPLVSSYLEDLVTWGLIGARTSESALHRQLASGFSFPIGFKNRTDGNIETAIQGIVSAQSAHTYFGFNPEGHISSVHSLGNPFCHLVLRGGNQSTNYQQETVHAAISLLKQYNLSAKLMIDCAHGNSKKNPFLQKTVIQSVLNQITQGTRACFALMIESHLHSGKQPLGTFLAYGVSVTDPCLGWEETEECLLSIDAHLSSLAGMTRSVQNGCSHSPIRKPSSERACTE